MTSPLRLSDRDTMVVQTVIRFRQVSASQLRRLWFADGSEASRGIRQRRTLARLVKWGAIARIPRPIGGGLGGSADYIYVPTSSRARTPDAHTLDVTELFVRLVEAAKAGEMRLWVFDPEPYCHIQVGHLELKPDAFVRLQTARGTYRAFIEVDRGTEWRPQLNGKMRRYNQAYHKWTDATFPQVLFLVPDEQRRRLVEGVVKRQENPGLFDVLLFEEALPTLIGER